VDLHVLQTALGSRTCVAHRTHPCEMPHPFKRKACRLLRMGVPAGGTSDEGLTHQKLDPKNALIWIQSAWVLAYLSQLRSPTQWHSIVQGTATRARLLLVIRGAWLQNAAAPIGIILDTPLVCLKLPPSSGPAPLWPSLASLAQAGRCGDSDRESGTNPSTPDHRASRAWNLRIVDRPKDGNRMMLEVHVC
jgi:hypothetical protein